MNIDKKALKGIVDEIEASRARQRGETEHQREVMKRAKAHQLDAKAIRIVLQRRAMGDTKRDEQDYYVHSYEVALGGKKDAIEALERGATVREAATAGGISTGAAGNLAKVVQKSAIVDADPTTGEINGGQGEGHNRAHEGARPSHGGDADGLLAGDGGEAESRDGEGEHQDRDRGANGDEAEPQVTLGAVAEPQAERVAPEIIDDLAFPAHLRRVRV